MLTRRTLLTLAPAALAHAQLPSRVNYRHYGRGLPDYLTALAAAARARREGVMAKLTSPASIANRQRWARETFWSLAGGKPELTPLNQRTTGSFERDGYRVDKLVYESRPGLTVTANLYVPTSGKPPYPGVLFQMGHSNNGKSAALYQKCCQGLARLGYIVLAFDPFGQGERLYYPERVGATGQHSMAGRQMLLTGDTASQAMVWDAVRSLDVLAAHPMVDPQRLASTGQSGGAMMTQLLACVDSRLAAAAVSSGNTENFACANFIPPGSADDAEQDFIGSGAVGFDRWDLLYPLAPKPLLVLVSARDFFGTYSPNYLTDGRAEFARLAAVYERLGHKGSIAWKETPLPHALTYGLRLEIYNWFERWLKHSDRVIAAEPPVSPEKDETLWCGPTGNVVRDFTARSPVDFSRERVRKTIVPIAQLLKVAPVKTAQRSVLALAPSEGVDILAIEVQSQSGVFLPAWLFAPRIALHDTPIVLVLDARGHNAGADEGGFYTKLARSGLLLVCAADLRGSGDAMPRGRATEEDYAWGSLILGRPLVSQRVVDVLALVGALAAREIGPIIVAANGKMATVAMLAAAVDARIWALYLAGGAASFENEVIANIMPGIMRHTDLPQIAASLAPRRVKSTGEQEWTVDSIRAFVESSTPTLMRHSSCQPQPAGIRSAPTGNGS